MFLARRLSSANLLTNRRMLLQQPLLGNATRVMKSTKVRAPLFFDAKSITFNPSKKQLLSAEYMKPRITHKGKRRPQKVQVTWECEKCNRRDTDTVYKSHFENAMVSIRCDGCRSLNTIVDNLGFENFLSDTFQSLASSLDLLDEEQDDSAESSSCLSDEEEEEEFWSLFDGAEEN